MPVIFDSTDHDKKNKETSHAVDLPMRSSSPSKVKPSNKTPQNNIHKKKQTNQFPRKTSVMGAYITRPTRVYFATQGTNEQILLFLRKHPVTQLPWIFTTSILVILPIILTPIINEIIKDTFFIPVRFAILLFIFWYLATFAYTFVNFILWYYNINIVTNKRVVDIDFNYLLVQEVTATRIQQIEDVTYKRTGAFAIIFDYGNIFIQTAGTEVNIDFLSVPKPRQIGKIIIDLMGNTILTT